MKPMQIQAPLSRPLLDGGVGKGYNDIMISRRGFLKIAGKTLVLASAAPAVHVVQALGAGRRRSRVVVVRDHAVLAGDGTVNKDVAKVIVDKAVRLVTGKKNASDAWKSLFGAGDVVGIKVNCLAERMLSTKPALCFAVVEGLKTAGVHPGNIVIWEQISEKLRRAGYRIATRKGSVLCYGNDMAGYEPTPEAVGSIMGSCFAKILTRQCTAIVNMPVLKDHDLAGVTLSMKNFFGAIHNPNKYHDDNCNPFIADLSTYPSIVKKQRLIIVDATTGLYHGGPSYKKKYIWPFAGVIAGTDPVAIDAFGAKVIEDKRAERGLPSLAKAGRGPIYIERAAELGVGVADLSRIDVVGE